MAGQAAIMPPNNHKKTAGSKRGTPRWVRSATLIFSMATTYLISNLRGGLFAMYPRNRLLICNIIFAFLIFEYLYFVSARNIWKNDKLYYTENYIRKNKWEYETHFHLDLYIHLVYQMNKNHSEIRDKFIININVYYKYYVHYKY